MTATPQLAPPPLPHQPGCSCAVGMGFKGSTCPAVGVPTESHSKGQFHAEPTARIHVLQVPAQAHTPDYATGR